jgi:tetratricopeptide (TPR) repeat protein
MIINDLGKEFNDTVVPVDSIFASASPDGIVGDNLIVDHLHPNVKGYQLMGKAFYDCMEKEGYLPKKENAQIPFNEQDSLTCANFMFTKLDSIIGNYGVTILKENWPYKKKSKMMSEFQQKDFVNLLHPKDFIDSLAMFKIESKVSWADAHFIGATYYLRRDDIKEYLKYMNVLIYQYPSLLDLDGALRYYYEKKELDLADYTPKRNGLMALYIGKFDNAIKYLSEAFRSNPKDPLILYSLSLAYSKKRDFKTAFSFIDKCLIADPNYPEANNLKKQILDQIKN